MKKPSRFHVGNVLLLAVCVLFARPAAPANYSDFDSDGTSDVFWRNAATGENYIYPMNGVVIKPTEGYLRTVPDQNWRVVGIGNFDGAGGADLLWRNDSTGEHYLYLMDGASIVGEGYLRTIPDLYWQVAGVGDFDGDGKADILWRNLASGQNYIYLMDGLTIKPDEGYIRTVADKNWLVAGVGDFDGDGRADILWRNFETGENYLYPMDGTAIQAGEGYLRTVAELDWQVAGVGDFDGDGRADILWRNRATGENYFYPMNGRQILAGEGYLRTVADQNWRVAAVADYDGDGRADVLWRHAATGENYVYFMLASAITAEGYLRTVADTGWAVIGRSPPAEFDALTMNMVTVNYLVDLATGTHEFEVPAQCTGNPVVNCPGGVPLDPLPRILLTRAALTITPTADPSVYGFSAQGAVQTLSPIKLRYNTGVYGTINCDLSVNTAAGSVPTVRVDGSATFGRHTPGGPVNRIDAVNVQLTQVESADVNLTGSFYCSLLELYLPTFIAQITTEVEATLIAEGRVCGAPGAPQYMQCP